MGLPVLVAVAAYERAREGRKYAALLKAIAAFAAMQLTALLTFDFELMRMMSNPLVYEVADTLEHYTFRSGFVQSVYGISSAAWVFRFLVQAVLAIPFYFLLKSLFKRDYSAIMTSMATMTSLATMAKRQTMQAMPAKHPPGIFQRNHGVRR